MSLMCMIFVVIAFWLGCLYGAYTWDKTARQEKWYREDLDEYLETKYRDEHI